MRQRPLLKTLTFAVLHFATAFIVVYALTARLAKRGSFDVTELFAFGGQRATRDAHFNAQFLRQTHQIGGIAALIVGNAENGQFFVWRFLKEAHAE